MPLYVFGRVPVRARQARGGPERIDQKRKKENRQPKRGMGEVEDTWTGSTPARAGFWKDDAIRGTGGALLLLTRDTTGSQRGARWNPNGVCRYIVMTPPR